jgi:hypothetical protein
MIVIPVVATIKKQVPVCCDGCGRDTQIIVTSGEQHAHKQVYCHRCLQHGDQHSHQYDERRGRTLLPRAF